MDADPPTLFYTRVLAPDLEIGQVATATLKAEGEATWESTRADVVVDVPHRTSSYGPSVIPT